MTIKYNKIKVYMDKVCNKTQKRNLENKKMRGIGGMDEKNKLNGKKKKIKTKVLDDVLNKQFENVIMKLLKQIPEEDLKKLDNMSEEDRKILVDKVFAVESLEEFQQCFK